MNILTQYRYRLLPLGTTIIAIAAIGLLAVYSYRGFSQWLMWPNQMELVVANVRPVTQFPLKIEFGKRYLVDKNGKPFLVLGDAAWSLIADLKREEVDIYLTDRRARGFNTLLVNLIEHKFSRNAPANAYGDKPFGNANDFTKPNDAYFKHALWVLQQAREKGFLVLLAPSYAGWAGGDQGWWKTMVANGPRSLRAYGRFVGEYFGHLDNVVWVNGGDYDPPDRSLVEAVALGIKETAPGHLHTAHNAPETRIDEFWRDASWLDIVNVYTYNTICDRVGALYTGGDRRPFFHMESYYENEHGTGPHKIRIQAYHAILCGAGGHVFGNNPVWHFHHKGLYPAPASWWASLGTGGTVSMTRWGELFNSLPWHVLRPDLQGDLLIRGRGEGFDLAMAAHATDGSLAVIYIPTGRTIVINLKKLDGPAFSARWFDPVSGTSTPIDVSTVGLSSKKSSNMTWRIATPGRNAGGDSDWVLVLASKQVGG